jgi:hypothetical protein
MFKLELPARFRTGIDRSTGAKFLFIFLPLAILQDDRSSVEVSDPYPPAFVCCQQRADFWTYSLVAPGTEAQSQYSEVLRRRISRGGVHQKG